MPAVTLQKRTIQRSQNCGVRQAWETATLWVEMRAEWVVEGTSSRWASSPGRGDADGEDAEHHESEVERAHDHHGVGDGGLAVRI